ncbi:MAG: hypothetical protein LBR16_05980 [Treponema sp.]|jgi:hypothetical protein|nr:hypothetical protein [Treponema sp.]
MNITINGKRADITLENEKTVGDVLVGVNKWLETAGMLPAGLAVDGKKISLDHVEEAFALAIDQVRDLNIDVTPRDALAAEAWGGLIETITRFANAPFAERADLAAQWRKSPHATFLAAEDPAAWEQVENALEGKGESTAAVAKMAAERMRECGDPEGELKLLAPAVEAIEEKLRGIPLALQTGQDKTAMDTVQEFSSLSQKLFRLIAILNRRGISLDRIDGNSLSDFVNGFSTALEDLSGAYEEGDTVLIGDIAEYECAPRIAALFEALLSRVE